MFPVASSQSYKLNFLVMSFCYKYMNVLPIIPLSSNTKRVRITYAFNYFNILFYYKFIHSFFNLNLNNKFTKFLWKSTYRSFCPF